MTKHRFYPFLRLGGLSLCLFRCLLFSSGLISFLLVSCARAPIRNQSESLRVVKEAFEIGDDLDFQNLARALRQNIDTLGQSAQPMNFGPYVISRSEYALALQTLEKALLEDPTGEKFKAMLVEQFIALEVYGNKTWGEVFLTSYFEPVIEGSLTPTEKFSRPLLYPPVDLVEVDLTTFAQFSGANKSLYSLLEQKAQKPLLRGRLITPQPEKNGSKKNVSARPIGKVIGLASRQEISNGALSEVTKTLAFVDPLDGFFLEIQGSGVVKLTEKKELRLTYASQNGHPYVAIGQFVFDKIPKEKLNLHTLEAHLRSLREPQRDEILNKNPSYVFFQPTENAGISFFGTEVVEGRTIATDQTFFPKGALAFLSFSTPVFKDSQSLEPENFRKVSRFVLDQDTGGAIRGPGRVDLFWGRGHEAKRFAGVIKDRARLVYWLPKQAKINR